MRTIVYYLWNEHYATSCIWTNFRRGSRLEKSNYSQNPSEDFIVRARRATRRQRALIRISINRQRNGARIDHFVSVFWKRPGGRNRLLAQTLAHKNFKLVLVCQPGRVISIDCEDNVPFWKLSPPNRSSSLENPPSQPNSKFHRKHRIISFVYSIYIRSLFFTRESKNTYELFLITPMYILNIINVARRMCCKYYALLLQSFHS